jgi:hypothetical protein
MADENVTALERDRETVERLARLREAAPEQDFEQAVEEQQQRVSRLQALIQCVAAEAGEPSGACDDIAAAILGLADLAGEIAEALDIVSLTQRATQLAAEVRS